MPTSEIEVVTEDENNDDKKIANSASKNTDNSEGEQSTLF